MSDNEQYIKMHTIKNTNILHRIDGPAVEGCGYAEYYLDGEPYAFEKWLDQTPEFSPEQKLLFRIAGKVIKG